MKTKHLLYALCALAMAGLTSCFGFDAALDSGYYDNGYDGLWYNGYGYGNNYYGGYWGPNYGWGPGLPPPLIGGGPGPVRPPHQGPSNNPGANVPNGPAFPTRPNGSQRPGNNGLPSGSVDAGRPVTLPDNVPVGRTISPTQTTINRGRP